MKERQKKKNETQKEYKKARREYLRSMGIRRKGNIIVNSNLFWKVYHGNDLRD